jgi:hypothetical protein
MLVGLRSLEELSNLRREQVVLSLLVVQKMTEATLGQAKPIPGSHIEIPNPYGPGGIEGRLSILVGMLVEFVSEGNATKAEAKLRFVDLPTSVIHQNLRCFARTRTTGERAGSNMRNLERDLTRTSVQEGHRPRNPSILEDFPIERDAPACAARRLDG